MSQPFDRMALCPAPIKPDERLKDWWVENPWQIASKGKSLSGYERNRVFINHGGTIFFEISGITGGADTEGDSRAFVAADFNDDGRQDFIVRQAGGGPFLMFENHLPQANWLAVSLEGTKSNRQGIGARITAEAGEQAWTRDVFPANSFKSQGPASVHFGLGTAKSIDRLTIQWPSGTTQVLENVAANQALRVKEEKK